MSRFNDLRLGDPSDAAGLLDYWGKAEVTEVTQDDLRLALVNALRRISDLEKKCESMRSNFERHLRNHAEPDLRHFV